jgi:putative flavoprotein involved in K+ transport
MPINSNSNNGTRPERFINTVVIGGGQSGLCVGKYLTDRGVEHVILDAEKRTGDSWRKRWDSLMLFTPAMFNALPGLPYPAAGNSFVTKDEMADYLEGYARTTALPIEHGERVIRLGRKNGLYIVQTENQKITAENVVVAMANYQLPRVPEFAHELDAETVQLHSSEYRGPAQLKPGNVLVVGAGNSGADIALELAASREVWMSGQENGHIPFRIEGFFGRNLGIRMVRFLGHHILNTSTPAGRKVRPKFLREAGPLVRVKPQDLLDAGVKRIGRTIGVRNGLPMIEGRDEPLDVQNIVWCTGYRPGFSWIDLPVLDERGYPIHVRGVAPSEPGLYFVGLHFLHAATSAVVAGVARDARFVVKALVSRTTDSKQDTGARRGLKSTGAARPSASTSEPSSSLAFSFPVRDH